jgi:glutathione S-transferase
LPSALVFLPQGADRLYESDVSFKPVFVDLGDENSIAKLRALWPVAKFPVLRNETRDHTVAEATVIIEYLATYYSGARKLVPADPDLAWQARMWDRFFDLYVHVQMQKIVADRVRPADASDAFGVGQAKAMVPHRRRSSTPIASSRSTARGKI